MVAYILPYLLLLVVKMSRYKKCMSRINVYKRVQAIHIIIYTRIKRFIEIGT